MKASALLLGVRGVIGGAVGGNGGLIASVGVGVVAEIVVVVVVEVGEVGVGRGQRQPVP